MFYTVAIAKVASYVGTEPTKHKTLGNSLSFPCGIVKLSLLAILLNMHTLKTAS